MVSHSPYKRSYLCYTITSFLLVFLRHFKMDEAMGEGARTIARACREAGVKQFIHVSALNASGDSPSAFLRAKVRWIV